MKADVIKLLGTLALTFVSGALWRKERNQRNRRKATEAGFFTHRLSVWVYDKQGMLAHWKDMPAYGGEQ